MASASRVISIDLVAKNNASSTFQKVATDAEKASAKASTAFEQSSSKIGKSFSKLGDLGASFGLPFAAGLGVVGTKLDETAAKGQKFGSTLSSIGGAELLAAGAGVALVGHAAVDAARDFETANARLQVAVRNTGASFESAEPGITKTDDAMRKLGFTDTETESSLARLTGVTHNVAQAQNLMGLAADTARATHSSLADATTILVQAEAGRLRGIGKIIGSTKDANGATITTTEAFRRLNEVVGGQGAAYLSTFDGKMAAVRAQADKLEVTLGQALIPKIESLASASVSAVQGFENANRATDGFLGKAIAVGAAVPIAIFGIEKLGTVALAVGGQFGKISTAVQAANTATTAVAAAEGALATAMATSSTARAGKLATTTATATAEQAEVAAALEAVAADTALAASLEAVAFAGGEAATAEAAVAAASAAAATANAGLAAASTAVAGAQTAEAGAAISATAAGAGLAGGLGLLAKVYSDVNTVTHGNIISIKGWESSIASVAELIPGANIAATIWGHTLGLLPGLHHKSADAAKEDAISTLQDAQAKAIAAVENDKLSGNSSKLASDKAHLAEISRRLSGAESEVNGVLNAGTSALDANATAASQTAANYQKLGQAASDAFDKINNQAQGGTSQQLGDKQSFQSAVEALHTPASSSSGGGSGQTATAAALDQAGKQLSVRDAYRQVQQAATGITDAEKALAKAQTDASTAAKAAADAQKNYEEILKGVPASSQAARDATEAFARAQDAAKSSALDLIDAQRALEDAKDAAANAGRSAQQGAQGASLGLAGAQLDVKDAQAALARARETEDPETIQRAQLALGDAQLRVAQATDANTAAQKALSEVGKKNSKENEDVVRAQIGVKEAQLNTKDSATGLEQAQRTLNDTLHGYPANSKEAKAAQDQLTQAQQAARDAADQVTSAQQGLQSAQDQTATSALNLKRAIADMNGQLDSTAGSTSGAINKFQDFIDKTTAVKNAATTMAQHVGHDVAAATHSAGAGILAEIGSLADSVAAEPIISAAVGDFFSQLYSKYANYLVGKQIDNPVASTYDNGARRTATGTLHALGGSFYAGQRIRVGERGPEDLEVPFDGRVVPTDRLANSKAIGGSFVFNHYGDVYGDMDMERIAVKAVQKYTENNPHVTPGRRR